MKKKLIAAGAALLMSTGAQAAIVTFNTPIAVTNSFDGTYINWTSGAVGVEAPGFDFNPYNSGPALSFYWGGIGANGGVASGASGPYLDLAPGAVVSAASTFAAVTASSATNAFKTTGDHILGFRFLNEGTGLINYGYAYLSATASTGFPLTITGWAYENSGAAITVAPLTGPAVPEPASWALMLGGIALVGGLQRARMRKMKVSFT